MMLGQLHAAITGCKAARGDAKEGRDNEGMDVDSVASDASLSAHLDNGSRRVFSVDSLRLTQRVVVEAIAFGRESIGKPISVDQT